MPSVKKLGKLKPGEVRRYAYLMNGSLYVMPSSVKTKVDAVSILPYRCQPFLVVMKMPMLPYSVLRCAARAAEKSLGVKRGDRPTVAHI